MASPAYVLAWQPYFPASLISPAHREKSSWLLLALHDWLYWRSIAAILEKAIVRRVIFYFEETHAELAGFLWIVLTSALELRFPYPHPPPIDFGAALGLGTLLQSPLESPQMYLSSMVLETVSGPSLHSPTHHETSTSFSVPASFDPSLSASTLHGTYKSTVCYRQVSRQWSEPCMSDHHEK